MAQEKEILKVGDYNVERADELAGIRVFCLHYGTEIIPFYYLGHDPVADLYFFKSRKKESWVLYQPYENLLTKHFHPFLLDLDRIWNRKEEF